MGLDMYLSAATYLGGWETAPPEEKAAYARVLAEAGISDFAPLHGMREVTVKVLVARWKNAYQVHDWFVAHAMQGEDVPQAECEVPREDLEALLVLCKQLLKRKSRARAAELLPTPEGCLAGENDWEWYWWNLDVTVRQLEAVLKDPQFQKWEFFYQAS